MIANDTFKGFPIHLPFPAYAPSDGGAGAAPPPPQAGGSDSGDGAGGGDCGSPGVESISISAEGGQDFTAEIGADDCGGITAEVSADAIEDFEMSAEAADAADGDFSPSDLADALFGSSGGDGDGDGGCSGLGSAAEMGLQVGAGVADIFGMDHAADAASAVADKVCR